MSKEGEDINSGDNQGANITPNKPDIQSPPVAPQPFNEPKVLEAVVEPKQKPQEGPVQFSFSTPQAIHEKQAQPAKGDMPKEKDPTVQDVLNQIAREEKAPDSAQYSDYYDNAEMLIDAWTTGLASFANWFAGDSAISTYEYPKPTADKLKKQLTKVLIKNKKMLPIEIVFGGTFVGATVPVLLKMTKRRKEYISNKEKEELELLKKKAEQNPSDIKSTERGPGRPEKGYKRRRA